MPHRSSDGTTASKLVEPSSAGELRASASLGFAAQLRDHTATVHREAERAGFIADMIRGRASRPAYLIYLQNLLPVYLALERAIDARAAPAMSAFADRRLHRAASLRADVDALAGVEGTSDDAPLAATLDYVDAIARSAESGSLVAHAYARYLGDLSGGQILVPLLARTLGVPAAALSFYDFPAIPDKAAQKSRMRDELDSIAPGSSQALAILDEAIVAFRHNIALSNAVQAAAAKQADLMERGRRFDGKPASS